MFLLYFMFLFYIFLAKSFFSHFCRCCCGLSFTYHAGLRTEIGEKGEIWSPAKYTMAYPTDAYGTIEFQGGPHPTKAQVCYLSLVILLFYPL